MNDVTWSPLKIWSWRIAILTVFFGLWEIAAATDFIKPILIGRPSGIFKFMYQSLFVTGELYKDFGYTLTSILASFVIGSVAGILVGMLFITRPNIDAMMNPIMLALNAMPRIALAPLFLIWFGLGMGSKIALGFTLTFFVVLTNTVAGGRGVNPDHITLARTLGASESQIFGKFVLPSAVPVIFNGLRLGLIFSLLGVIGGEIFASDHGIGQVLALYGASFKTNGVFGIIFMLAAIGVGITVGMTALENRLLRWR
jgi:NitT/TauT family transport system permease protein